MIRLKRFDSSEGNVWKYVFHFSDAIAEAVLYRYGSFEQRTVICCSVQSGCPVGCAFCGTGKRFIRNLTAEEIGDQVSAVLSDMNIADINQRASRFQIMFMSMGEPFLNMFNVIKAIEALHSKYPNAELLISTVGMKNNWWPDFFCASQNNPRIGLQFSLHSGYESIRDSLIPVNGKMTIRELRDVGVQWNKIVGRPVYLNYCVTGSNALPEELDRLKDLFPSNVFNFTFSVLCSPDETKKDAGFRNKEKIKSIMNSFLSEGYNARMFDPAGQDDIGGGCGQLWYVQKWLEHHERAHDARVSEMVANVK